MIYESEHSLAVNELTVTGEKDAFNFPLHLHKAFEVIAVTEGEMRIYVDSQSYGVKAGEAVLVFPDQVHAFETLGFCKHFLIIFAPEHIKAFVPFCLNNAPKSNLFTPSKGLFEKLRAMRKDDGVLHIKSVLYTLADEFDKSASYLSRCPENETLLFRIFDFVRQNYAGCCTLTSLAAALSYQYCYLSRYFSDRTGTSFTKYVTSYRLSESCYRLTNSADSITKIALDCGFDSPHTFNRCFVSQIGTTPGKYRKRYLDEMAKKQPREDLSDANRGK